MLSIGIHVFPTVHLRSRILMEANHKIINVNSFQGKGLFQQTFNSFAY